MKVKILGIEKITHDVKGFKVEKPKGYVFVPGQATEVSVDREGLRDKKRPFTLTSLKGDDYLEFVIKGYPISKYPNHTGVTEAIHKLKVGDYLLIEEPWGAIKYKGTGVFIAGGAGITPFIAIIRQLNKDNKLKGNKLIFTNKTRKDIILKNELKSYFDEKDLILIITREESKGYETRRINSSFLKRYIDSFEKPFYVCGPKKMVGEINQNLEDLGVTPDSIIFEK